MNTLISLLVELLISGLIFGLIFWIVDLFPFIPAPFKQVIKAIVGLILVIWLITSLLGVGGLAPLSIR